LRSVRGRRETRNKFTQAPVIRTIDLDSIQKFVVRLRVPYMISPVHGVSHAVYWSTVSLKEVKMVSWSMEECRARDIYIEFLGYVHPVDLPFETFRDQRLEASKFCL